MPRQAYWRGILVLEKLLVAILARASIGRC